MNNTRMESILSNIQKINTDNLLKEKEEVYLFAFVCREFTSLKQYEITEFLNKGECDFIRLYENGKLIANKMFNKTELKKLATISKNKTIVNKSSLTQLINMVGEFRESFELPVRNTPQLIPNQEFELNFKLSQEENLEYLDACDDSDTVEVLDALTDEFYIWCGKVLSHGMQDFIVDAFNEVHSSNMSKLDENGKPIKRADGKVLKGDNYFKPNLDKILNNGK